MTHLTGIRCPTKKDVEVPACDLPDAQRLVGGCLLREASLVAGGTGTQLKVLEKKNINFLYLQTAALVCVSVV